MMEILFILLFIISVILFILVWFIDDEYDWQFKAIVSAIPLTYIICCLIIYFTLY